TFTVRARLVSRLPRSVARTLTNRSPLRRGARPVRRPSPRQVTAAAPVERLFAPACACAGAARCAPTTVAAVPALAGQPKQKSLPLTVRPVCTAERLAPPEKPVVT